MARVKLTAKGVEALSTHLGQEDFWDVLTPGLCLRVSGKTGRKTWLIRYRSNGQHRRTKLGEYPALSLAAAREAARIALSKADAGEDPAKERKDRRSGRHTFGDLAEEVLAAKDQTTRPTTRHERRRILKRELLPEWEHRPAASITRREVAHLVEAIAGRGSPTMANRTLGLVKVIFREGLRRGFPTLESNPTELLVPTRPEPPRRRFLGRDEIRAVWSATEAESLATRSIFRLTLLTAARVGNVMAMRWEDMDERDIWTIPAEAFKGRRPHLVPLSPQSLSVLRDIRVVSGSGGYTFPGRSDGSRPHVTSVNRALQRIRERSEVPGWTVHDFRRTFRTWAVRAEESIDERDPVGLGLSPHVADAVLGHKEASLGFDRYTGEPERYLLGEKREALTKWGNFVVKAVQNRSD